MLVTHLHYGIRDTSFAEPLDNRQLGGTGHDSGYVGRRKDRTRGRHDGHKIAIPFGEAAIERVATIAVGASVGHVIATIAPGAGPATRSRSRLIGIHGAIVLGRAHVGLGLAILLAGVDSGFRVIEIAVIAGGLGAGTGRDGGHRGGGNRGGGGGGGHGGGQTGDHRWLGAFGAGHGQSGGQQLGGINLGHCDVRGGRCVRSVATVVVAVCVAAIFDVATFVVVAVAVIVAPVVAAVAWQRL